MTTDLFEPNNPAASPQQVATSPISLKVFNSMSDRKNQPAVANYVTHFYEDNPQADSQEGYDQANDYVRILEGLPKKKRSRKSD
jgi:hypothetical protein